MNIKTLIFFLDGATWDLIDPWIAEGHLPNFKLLKLNGAYGKLESVLPPTTHTALPAFYTGAHPADLGLLNLEEVDGAMMSSSAFAGMFFWEKLSERGFSSLIQDLPFTYPPRPFNGTLFTGFYTPENADDFVYPPEKQALYPDYPKGGVEIMTYLKEGFDNQQLLGALYDITIKRFETFMNELSLQNYDCACYYVKATDILQHFFWDDKEELLKFYTMLDHQLEEICKTHEIETIMMLSDHGFSDAPKDAFFINAWLENEGYVVWKRESTTRSKSIMRSFLQKHLAIARIVYRLNNKLKRLMMTDDKQLENTKGKGYTMSESIDLSKSRAYAVGGALRGKGIFINSAVITDARERDAIKKEIMEKLKNEMYAQSPIIQLIREGSDISLRKDMVNPDIIFLQNERFFVNDRYSDVIVTDRVTNSRAKGHHLASLYGIFMLSGKNIRKGEVKDVSLMDMYPTLLSRYGITAENCSGKVLHDLFL